MIPDKLLELQAGESTSPQISSLDDLSSPINPEVIAPLLRNLVQPNRTRARVYDPDGVLIFDSKFLYTGGQVLRYDLPGLEGEKSEGMISLIGNFLNRLLQRRDLPTYQEFPNSGINYPEVVSALTGSPSTVVRMTQKGEQVISVAVPIQRLRIVSGVLLLSTEGNGNRRDRHRRTPRHSEDIPCCSDCPDCPFSPAGKHDCHSACEGCRKRQTGFGAG